VKKRFQGSVRSFSAMSLIAMAVVVYPAGPPVDEDEAVEDVEAAAEVVAGSSTITGTVFQDFGSDGEMNIVETSGTATDVGIAGVTVNAFNAAGDLVGSTLSTADGSYTLGVTEPLGTALRVEFSTPNSGPLAVFRPSFFGSGNGTTVQFVDAGATGVDAGFNVPGEYCQSNPSLAVSRLCAGRSVSGGPAINPSVFVTRYDGGPYSTARGFSDIYTDWSTVTAAQGSLTGTVLGMAWDPNSGRIYNTAYIRRHAELYEKANASGTVSARPGAVFVTIPGASGLGGSTSFLVDLEELLAGDQFSNVNGDPGDVGFIPTNAERQIDCIEHKTSAQSADPCYRRGLDSNLKFADPDFGTVGVYEAVGQTGIGEIEVDDQGNLYVVSLYDKNLYKVAMPADGSAPTTMVSLGDITAGVSCTNGVARPFAVTLWRGSLYLGMTCDGSGDFPADVANYDPLTSLDTNITFTIRRYDLGSGQWSTQFGPQSLAGMSRGSVDGTSDGWAATSRRWNPWTNQYAVPMTVGGFLQDTFAVRPVPMFSDIAFDSDGSMILGFRDRNGDQLATNGSESPIGTNTNYPAIASGDIYRLCRTGTGYTSADYTFEGGAGCTQTVNAANGTEYYTGDKYFSYHYEISAGMLEQVPGFPDVILTGFDPYDGDGSDATFYAGGIRYLQNSSGGNADFPNDGSGVIFFSWDDPTGNVNKAGGFLKTNGMSDVEALCDQAPVQIGNRVWIDTNADGIQDPDEQPVAGVTVRLYSADGQTLLGTAITNADGEYYFSSNITEPADGGANPDHIGGGVVIGQDHVVRFDNPADYEDGGPLEPYVLTTVTSGDNTSIDSDADLVDGFPQISVPARKAGENDHSFDVGFYLASEQVPDNEPADEPADEPGDGTNDPAAPESGSLIRVSVGDYVWWDTNRDGRQDDSDVPLKEVELRIFTADGGPVVNVFGGRVVRTFTDRTGWYTFDDLPPGQYKVCVIAPAGYVPTIAGVGPSDQDSSTECATSRILSVDGERDPTLDFGFVPSGAVLPRTGTDSPNTAAALLLIVVGLLLLAPSRLRRLN
jgi:hypothetical protein